MPRRATTFGVISDTHGLLRPGALARLAGADRILHAGDIGGPALLAELAALAPVTAVRGNNDRDAWGRALPETAVIEAAGRRIYMLHDRNQLAIDPRAEGFAVVISGHSHKPGQSREGGVLYINPGSAGPRRFKLPITVARLHMTDDNITAEILDCAEPPDGA
jgi:putative phosphoesterase